VPDEPCAAVMGLVVAGVTQRIRRREAGCDRGYQDDQLLPASADRASNASYRFIDRLGVESLLMASRRSCVFRLERRTCARLVSAVCSDCFLHTSACASTRVRLGVRVNGGNDF